MDENIAVIGTNDNDANAAYVFAPVNTDETSSSWTQMAKVTGSTGSIFGYSVAVAGNWIVVGAPFDDNANGIDAGAVYVFTKTSSSWTQTTQLLAADGAAYDGFGASVSISKDTSTIVVGAIHVDFNTAITDSGAAYLFRATNNTTTTTTTTTTMEYTQMGKFVAADRSTGDKLGSSIAIEDNIVVVGAYGDDYAAGSVYIVDTGLSSSTTTATEPTVEPVIPKPTLNPTPNPIEQPINAGSGTVFTPGVIVAAIVVVGVVAIVFGVLNYRVKMQRNQGSPLPPLAPASGDVTPIMANVVLESPAQPVQDETLEADAAAVANVVGRMLPQYKDQMRNVEPSGPSANLLPLSDPNSRRHQHHQDYCPDHQLQADEPLPEQQIQQQQFRQDPPVVYKHSRQLLTYKEQVAL